MEEISGVSVQEGLGCVFLVVRNFCLVSIPLGGSISKNSDLLW